MKFQEYDLVRILKDCEEGVRKGEVGTVLLSFENPVEAYEVEFLDETGRQNINDLNRVLRETAVSWMEKLEI